MTLRYIYPYAGGIEVSVTNFLKYRCFTRLRKSFLFQSITFLDWNSPTIFGSNHDELAHLKVSDGKISVSVTNGLTCSLSELA